MDTTDKYHFTEQSLETAMDRRQERAGTAPSVRAEPRLPSSECGGGWYHDAAITAAKDDRHHPYRDGAR